MINKQTDEAYLSIKKYYGNRTAKRSGVPLISHIDEGLIILDYLGASDICMSAYCLHPLLQEDHLLLEWFTKDIDFEERLYGFDHNAEIIVLAMEYRNIANYTLSNKDIDSSADIKLSPLDEVNLMLTADKIQNYKDFEKYHKDTHENSDRLDRYFRLWLQKLGISLDEYEHIKLSIDMAMKNQMLEDLEKEGYNARFDACGFLCLSPKEVHVIGKDFNGNLTEYMKHLNKS